MLEQISEQLSRKNDITKSDIRTVVLYCYILIILN